MLYLYKSDLYTFSSCKNEDAKYKSETTPESEEWKEEMGTLESCLMEALAKQMGEAAVHCLNAIMNELQRNSHQIALLVDFIR